MLAVTTSELALPDDYPRLLAELKAKIQAAQRSAQRVVNTQLIELYWTIGKAILDRQSAEGWGAKVVDQLAVDLSLAFPDSKGFSRRNLRYMRRLAQAWPGPALEAPVDVDGRQMTLAGYLESMAAELSSGPDHGDN
jgi:hypothetical protein